MENLNFKESLIAILVSLLLIGCNDTKTYHISKGLDAILNEYTDKYNKDSVILIHFYMIENRMLLSIEHSPCYPKNEGYGCFQYKHRLVVYFSNPRNIPINCLIDTTFTCDKTILKQYKSCDEFADRFIYDGNSDQVTYFVKSTDCIMKAASKDLQYTKKVTGTNGINNDKINRLINKRLNNNNVSITAIRCATFDNSDFFMISDVNAFTMKSLSGCLKRNGRLISFYGIENLHNQNIFDIKLIRNGLTLLSNYTKLTNEEFEYISGDGDIYRILPNGEIEMVVFDKWPDEKCEMLYNSFQ